MKIFKKNESEQKGAKANKLLNLVVLVGKFLNGCKAAVFVLLVVLGMVVTSFYTGVVLAYNVEYNGEVIAQVREKGEYDKAFEIASGMVESFKFEDYAHTSKLSITVTTENQLATPNDVAVSLLEETTHIKKADAVYINGKKVAYINSEHNARGYIENYLSTYVDGENVKSSFVAPVELVEDYYQESLLTSFEEFKKVIGSLDVKSVWTLRTPVEVDFEIIKRRDDSLEVGEYRTERKGVKGVNNAVSQVIMLNGEIQKTIDMGQEVVVEPLSEIVIVGNKGNSVSSVFISELGCIWPLQKVKGQYVSAFYGDGRNHKGIDIASKEGTMIFAAQKGKVITSEYSDGYGYYVVIDHGNGYKTLYAHSSKLLVRKGDIVKQGEVIALVGTTGMSTGNHLHFEVIKDTNKLDPAPFLGL